MSLITPEILRRIVTALPQQRANEISALINEICPKYGINSKDILEEFLAQLIHESGSFRSRAENLNYTRPELLMKTWPTRFRTREEALPFVRNPKALANKVYNGRMGNRLGTDDGWNYRGSGFKQATGFSMFQTLKKGMKFEGTELELAELIRINDRWAMESACYIYAVVKGLIDESVNDEFKKITLAINGGLIGQKERVEWYELCKKHLQI